MFRVTLDRWGDVINETDFQEERAELMLVQRADVYSLPAAVRDLWGNMSLVTSICRVVGEQDPESHPVLKSTKHMADNSLMFGKKTVNVAAACKILFKDKKASEKNQALG